MFVKVERVFFQQKQDKQKETDVDKDKVASADPITVAFATASTSTAPSFKDREIESLHEKNQCEYNRATHLMVLIESTVRLQRMFPADAGTESKCKAIVSSALDVIQKQVGFLQRTEEFHEISEAMSTEVCENCRGRKKRSKKAAAAAAASA